MTEAARDTGVDLRPFIEEVAQGQALSTEAAEAVFSAVISGEASPVQVAAILMGLRTRGVLPSEVAGGVRALRRVMVPVPAEDPGDLVHGPVDPSTRLADALDLGDHLLSVGPVLEVDRDVAHLPGLVHFNGETFDEPLPHQGIGDAFLDARERNVDTLLAEDVGISDPGQHVPDRIRHGHDLNISIPWIELLLKPGRYPTSSPFSRRGSRPSGRAS